MAKQTKAARRTCTSRRVTSYASPPARTAASRARSSSVDRDRGRVFVEGANRDQAAHQGRPGRRSAGHHRRHHHPGGLDPGRPTSPCSSRSTARRCRPGSGTSAARSRSAAPTAPRTPVTAACASRGRPARRSDDCNHHPDRAPSPRLKERYRAEIVPALREEFGFGQPDAGADGHQGRRQHGCGRGRPRLQADRRRGP